MNAWFCRGRIAHLAVLLLILLQVSFSLRAQQQSTPDKSVPDKPPAAAPSPSPAKTASPTDVHLPRTPEDFSAISLKNSELEPAPPTLGSHIVKEKFTEDILQVQWRNFDAIDLYVAKPRGVEKPPVIIYLYGYPSNEKAFSNESWLERVTSGGYAAVGFVGALTDYRFRMRPMKETFLTELPESLATTTHDVQMVLNYLEKRGDLDMSRVGLFGTGSGATVAILAAAADSRVKAIECFEPWGNWPKWLATTNEIPPSERASYLKPEFLAKLASLDPVAWLPKLTTQKVQIQFVDADDALAKDSRAAIEAAAPQTALVLHFADRGQHFGAVSGGRLFDWLKAQLQPPPGNSAPGQSVKVAAQTP